jgi:SDR family mycofactocin-dependent oxidoreductase
MLDGKVAVVTGAARGQGRAHAVRLAADGADVIVIDVCRKLPSMSYEPASRDDLDETVRKVEKLGRRAFAGEADIREFSELKRVVDQGVSELGGLDIVVANAGVNSMARTWELTEEQWGEVIGVNLTGTWHTIKATVPILIEQGRGGSIILINSSAALRPRPLLSHYAASKAGAIGLMKSLATEVGQYDIRVNAVHPAAVDTPMAYAPEYPALLETSPGFAYAYENTGLLSAGLLDPREISAAVAWLASDESRFVTGSSFPVDNGSGTK